MKKEKSNMIVQRIESCYVGEDCIQTMIRYDNNFTVLNKDGILYHYESDSQNYINKYLEDERRKQFPYSSIPTHRTRIGFSKYMVTNQLQNFDEPYIRIYNNNVVESFAIKDNNEALLIKKVVPTFKRVEYRTRKEVKEMFKDLDDDKCLYFFETNGSMIQDISLDSEKKLVNKIKKHYLGSLKRYQKDTDFSYFDENQLKFFQYYIDNMSIKSLPNITNDGYIETDSFIIIKADGNDISIQNVTINFMQKNLYMVETLDMPVTRYTLEQIKDIIPMITKTKEPRIPLRLNPHIKKEDIKVEKKKVKSLYKQKSQF